MDTANINGFTIIAESGQVIFQYAISTEITSRVQTDGRTYVRNITLPESSDNPSEDEDPLEIYVLITTSGTVHPRRDLFIVGICSEQITTTG